MIPIPDAPCAAPCALTFALIYICNIARSCREIPGNSGNHTEIECFSCLIFARSMTQPPFNGFISWESLLEPTSCASIKCTFNVQAASSPCTTWTSPLWALVAAQWPCSCWPTLLWQLRAFPLRPSPRGIPWANGWGSHRPTRRLTEVEGLPFLPEEKWRFCKMGVPLNHPLMGCSLLNQRF